MTIIDFAAYIPLALRTEAPLPTPKDRLEHAALGLITETGESATEVKRIAIYGKSLDSLAKDGKTTLRQHIAEEIGDALWYVAIAADALGFVPDAKVPTVPGASENARLSSASFSLAANVGIFAGTLINTPAGVLTESQVSRLEIVLENIVDFLTAQANIIGIPLQQIADENIAKLALRYPDKFTAEAAEARADKAGADARSS